LQEPVLTRALTRFRLPWHWDGQPVVVQSRAIDETVMSSRRWPNFSRCAARTTFIVGTLLAKSLEIAQDQQARCWELRTACDLASLWRSKGQAKEGLRLLRPIYARFTEGFDSADLRHAKRILDDLQPSVPPLKRS
jgi:hypothetical protein